MYKIEVLYPEVANLFGDMFNIKFLERSINESLGGTSNVEIINTALTEDPRFLTEDVDLVYMGPMPEYAQELIVQALKPHKARIVELINSGKVFLFTGNAFEVFSEYIEDDDENKIECLGIYKGHAVRRMMARYNSLYLGKLESEDMDIIGFKSQFSKMYDVQDGDKLFKTIRECEPEDSAVDEGIRINNFFGTYLLGPLLIVCPNFAKYIMQLMGIESPKLAFEDYTMYCYDERMKDFLDPTKDFH